MIPLDNSRVLIRGLSLRAWALKSNFMGVLNVKR